MRRTAILVILVVIGILHRSSSSQCTSSLSGAGHIISATKAVKDVAWQPVYYPCSSVSSNSSSSNSSSSSISSSSSSSSSSSNNTYDHNGNSTKSSMGETPKLLNATSMADGNETISSAATASKSDWTGVTVDATGIYRMWGSERLEVQCEFVASSTPVESILLQGCRTKILSNDSHTATCGVDFRVAGDTFFLHGAPANLSTIVAYDMAASLNIALSATAANELQIVVDGSTTIVMGAQSISVSTAAKSQRRPCEGMLCPGANDQLPDLTRFNTSSSDHAIQPVQRCILVTNAVATKSAASYASASTAVTMVLNSSLSELPTYPTIESRRLASQRTLVFPVFESELVLRTVLDECLAGLPLALAASDGVFGAFVESCVSDKSLGPGMERLAHSTMQVYMTRYASAASLAIMSLDSILRPTVAKSPEALSASTAVAYESTHMRLAAYQTLSVKTIQSLQPALITSVDNMFSGKSALKLDGVSKVWGTVSATSTRVAAFNESTTATSAGVHARSSPAPSKTLAASSAPTPTSGGSPAAQGSGPKSAATPSTVIAAGALRTDSSGAMQGLGSIPLTATQRSGTPTFPSAVLADAAAAAGAVIGSRASSSSSATASAMTGGIGFQSLLGKIALTREGQSVHQASGSSWISRSAAFTASSIAVTHTIFGTVLSIGGPADLLPEASFTSLLTIEGVLDVAPKTADVGRFMQAFLLAKTSESELIAIEAGFQMPNPFGSGGEIGIARRSVTGRQTFTRASASSSLTITCSGNFDVEVVVIDAFTGVQTLYKITANKVAVGATATPVIRIPTNPPTLTGNVYKA